MNEDGAEFQHTYSELNMEDDMNEITNKKIGALNRLKNSKKNPGPGGVNMEFKKNIFLCFLNC